MFHALVVSKCTRVQEKTVLIRMANRLFLVFLSLPICACQPYYLSDKAGLGRVFDGIGGLSGGGVSTARTSWSGKIQKKNKNNDKKR